MPTADGYGMSIKMNQTGGVVEVIKYRNVFGKLSSQKNRR